MAAHTKRVSMPSELGREVLGRGLLAMRAGSVKERRTLALETLLGACAGLDAGAWEAMLERSRRHLGVKKVETGLEEGPMSSSVAGEGMNGWIVGTVTALRHGRLDQCRTVTLSRRGFRSLDNPSCAVADAPATANLTCQT